MAETNGIMSDVRNIGVRVTDDLHAWLTDLAAREHRSLNGQVTYLLERARQLMDYEAGNLPGRETPPPAR